MLTQIFFKIVVDEKKGSFDAIQFASDLQNKVFEKLEKVIEKGFW